MTELHEVEEEAERPHLPRAPRAGEAPAVSPMAYGLGLGLSVLWIGLGVFIWYGTAPQGFVERAMAVLSVVVPVALIWVLAVSLDQLKRLRGERERLLMVMDQMRLQAANAPAPREERRAVPREPSLRDDSPRLTFQSRRDAPAVPARLEEQPGLALGTPEEPAEPLSMADFLRAIHFPDGPDDNAAFTAIRLALGDRLASKLIRAAQDVLTLLSQEGIFMDDLRPDRARPELWRQFASGARGRAIAGLGGIRDRSSLALTAGRMREDPVFRDAAHHFLRTFDKVFVEAEANATDADLAELSDTRTARAFMLLGRVTGIFD